MEIGSIRRSVQQPHLPKLHGPRLAPRHSPRQIPRPKTQVVYAGLTETTRGVGGRGNPLLYSTDELCFLGVRSRQSNSTHVYTSRFRHLCRVDRMTHATRTHTLLFSDLSASAVAHMAQSILSTQDPSGLRLESQGAQVCASYRRLCFFLYRVCRAPLL